MDSKNIVQLCPNCQTGADSYKLDSREPVCPYLHLHTGQSEKKQIFTVWVMMNFCV